VIISKRSMIPCYSTRNRPILKILLDFDTWITVNMLFELIYNRSYCFYFSDKNVLIYDAQMFIDWLSTVYFRFCYWLCVICRPKFWILHLSYQWLWGSYVTLATLKTYEWLINCFMYQLSTISNSYSVINNNVNYMNKNYNNGNLI